MSTSTAPLRPGAAPEPDGLKRIGVQPSLREYLVDLWDHRDFLITVPLGELRAQNQNTVLGNFWHLLNPLLLAAVYYLIFGIIFQSARGVDNYAAFLIVGIMTYQFVAKAVQAGARTVVSNLKLIQSIRFPRASLPLASTLSETIAYGPALLTMMLLVIVTSSISDDPTILPTWSWLLVLPATAIMAVFGFGLALITARATFHFRDVQQLLPYLLRIWMYMSGLFYPVTWVEDRAGDAEWIVWLFKANPMWEFFRIFRDALGLGESVFDPAVWAAAAAWAVAMCLFGFVYFRAHEVEYSRG